MNPQVITDYIIGLNITDVEKCKKAYDEFLEGKNNQRKGV